MLWATRAVIIGHGSRRKPACTWSTSSDNPPSPEHQNALGCPCNRNSGPSSLALNILRISIVGSCMVGGNDPARETSLSSFPCGNSELQHYCRALSWRPEGSNLHRVLSTGPGPGVCWMNVPSLTPKGCIHLCTSVRVPGRNKYTRKICWLKS